MKRYSFPADARLPASRWLCTAAMVVVMLTFSTTQARAQNQTRAQIRDQRQASPGETEVQRHEQSGEGGQSAITEVEAKSPAQSLLSGREIAFQADTLAYDENSDTITASGTVVLHNADRSVRADKVVWDRKTGSILASGHVRMVDETGNQLYTQQVELNAQFDAGEMNDLLLSLRAGGRFAAHSGTRGADGNVVMKDAAYSACSMTDPDGCDHTPSWRVTANRIVYDPKEKQIRFTNAMLEVFGIRLVPLPGLTLRTDGGAGSGVLPPNLRHSKSNGLEISSGYYARIADNQDLSLTGYVYTETAPMVSAQWRHLTDHGAYQITGYGTYSKRKSTNTSNVPTKNDPRGYLFTNGKFQLTPEWSLTNSIRVASDRTFLRRYDISRDDRLRSTIDLERIDQDSYFSLAGWATQTLRIGQDQGQVPMALPAIDYRKRLRNLTGNNDTLELQANTLAILRDEGQDTQRGFASARWDMRVLTNMGQIIKLTGLARGDVYHSDENSENPTPFYSGSSGWKTRAIATSAIDVEWPLAGSVNDDTQVMLTPRVQLVASPPIRNLAVPNEDSRAIDLEDSNLFALNRFPGYDRVEEGVRLTYGLDWQLQRPSWRLKANIGQSYRFTGDHEALVDGTGIRRKTSDIVGRAEVRYRDFLKVTHRFRLDRSNLAIRRNEFDAMVGSRKTYAEIGYLRLDRNSDANIEDLQDREELRTAARVAFAHYWSIFGSGVFNLTDKKEDLSSLSDGFEAVRTRLGIGYEDDCLDMGLTWRRDYLTAGDAKKGDTFQIYLRLRNLGLR